MYDFVAIDFEIANRFYNSACSIGIAAVSGLEIIKQEYFLIQPPTQDFEFSNIHGIGYDNVKDSPYFPDIWNEIRMYFDGNIIIAHNAVFDMTVLKACDSRYDLKIPDFKYMCSASISSRICDCKISSSLEDRAKYLGIDIQDHHNALCDALTCANVVIQSIKKAGCNNLNEYRKRYKDVKLNNYSNVKASELFHRGHKRFNKVVISEIAATCEEIDASHIFYGKNFVFTGELKSMDRKCAMQKVVDLGGILKSAVSRKTNYLIVGVQDKALVGDDGLSSKEEDAYKFINEGYPIKILNEDEFLKFL